MEHVDPHLAAETQVCKECAELGDAWVQLRVCKTCGHVGCCDSSKNRHARAHFHETGHSVIGPASGAQDWLWCYEDDDYIDAG
jgi:uncharacterized UBP type Zn finger protein